MGKQLASEKREKIKKQKRPAEKREFEKGILIPTVLTQELRF